MWVSHVLIHVDVKRVVLLLINEDVLFLGVILVDKTG